MEWDDDEFTREPLDAAKPPHSDQPSDDSDPADERLPDDEFTREPLDPTRPAGNRTKRPARRVLLSIGGCALLAIVLLTSTGTAGSLWRQARFTWLTHTAPTLTRATITPQPAGKRTLPDGWQQQQQVELPNPDVSWFITAPNDPKTLYGCSASRTTSPTGIAAGPLTFWYSHDAGQHWASVRLPGTKDVYCGVSVASEGSGRLILLGQLYSGCANVEAYLSVDDGAHWHAIPALPDAPTAPDHDCNVSTLLSGRHLYLTYSYTTLSGSPQNQTSVEHWMFWRSDDSGQTWKRLDGNLPPEAENQFYPWLLDDGETLLLNVFRYDPATNGKPEHEETQLWVSRDTGDSWEPLASIEGFSVQYILPLADARALAPSMAHPLYLISGATMPWYYYRFQIAQVTDMQHWSPLPPLPIAGASPERLGILSILTTTPSGRLLVFGLGPDDHVPSDNSQLLDDLRPKRQWLWEWDPVASRWTLLAPALDVPWPHCGDHCWYGWITPAQDFGVAGVSLWAQEYDADEAGRWKTFRIYIQYTP
ncbi:MAG TPA: sialidase family protein [Ktedonobacterales bacterium]|nr:sialidase family protein [Ktedonobacterales bacterium]